MALIARDPAVTPGASVPPAVPAARAEVVVAVAATDGLTAHPVFAALKADALAHPALASARREIAPLTCDDDYGRLGRARATAKLIVKSIEEIRKKATEPLLKEQRAIKAEADRWTVPLVEWDKRAEQVELAYLRHKETERRLEEQAAQKALEDAAAKAAKAEAVGTQDAIVRASDEIMRAELHAQRVAVPVRGMKTEAGTSYLRTEYVFAGWTDLSQVPERFWRNEKVIAALQAVVSAAIRAGERDIPGVAIEQRESAPMRTR